MELVSLYYRQIRKWYSYIPDAPIEIIQSINYINFCFSFLLSGISLVLIMVQKKLFEDMKEIVEFARVLNSEMKWRINMEQCQICSKKPNYQGLVHVTVKENQQAKIMCRDCYNNYVSDMFGIDNYKDYEKEVVFKDCDDIEHYFQIEKMINPTGIGWEAKEYLDDENAGYSFEVCQEFAEDSTEAIDRLYKKIEKGLSKKFVEKSEFLGREFFTLKNNVAEGRIEWDDNFNGEIPKLIIDGQEYTLNDLGKMMMSCEGWNFRLEITEPTDRGRD